MSKFSGRGAAIVLGDYAKINEMLDDLPETPITSFAKSEIFISVNGKYFGIKIDPESLSGQLDVIASQALLTRLVEALYMFNLDLTHTYLPAMTKELEVALAKNKEEN